LTKDGVPEELKKPSRKLWRRTLCECDARREARRGIEDESDLPLHELLSDREFQVLRMIASGKTVKEIADELSLSVKTVSTYRARILEKTA